MFFSSVLMRVSERLVLRSSQERGASDFHQLDRGAEELIGRDMLAVAELQVGGRVEMNKRVRSRRSVVPRAACRVWLERIMVFGMIGALPASSLPNRLTSGVTFPERELVFECNEGQVGPETKFLARTSSYTLLLNRSGMILLGKGTTGDRTSALARPLTIGFDGSNRDVSVSGDAPSSARVNYFVGSDSRSWKRDITTYKKVKYTALYPGIDMVFYGRGCLLEYDFIVKPGGDLNGIALSVKGTNLSVRPDGDLVIPLGRGELRFHSPLIYQTSDQSGVRMSEPSIPGKYIVHGDHTVSFAVGPYDHTKTLVIDPVLAYSSYVGGTNDEGIFGIQRDKEGNIYVSGETSSLDFPIVDPIQPIEGDGGLNYDAFVSKFDPTCRHLIYSTYLGGSDFDHAVGLAVNENGEAFVAGITSSPNFPTKNALQAVLKGGQNVFIARLTRSGSDLVFSTYLGGSKYDGASDFTIDERSDIYLTGGTESPDYPTTPGSFQRVCGGYGKLGAGFCNFDAFVTKLAGDGSKLLYSTLLGGTSSDSGSGIAVDRAGAAYVVGQSSSSDFPLKNAFQPALAGQSNAFASKLDPSGRKLEFSTYLGGSGFDTGNAVALGPEGNVYLTGGASSADFPLVQAFQTTTKGSSTTCFVSELSRDGHELLKSTYVGGSGFDLPFRIAVDVFGSVSISGLTTSTDLPVVDAVQRHFGGGSYDAFALKLLPESFRPLYSTYLGGTGDEFGYGMYSERLGGLWVGGSTSSRNFPIRGGFQSKYAGGPFDAFLTRLGLTVPDYFRILEDLVRGDETLPQTELSIRVAGARRDLAENRGAGVIADLEEIDSLIRAAADGDELSVTLTSRALAASKVIRDAFSPVR